MSSISATKKDGENRLSVVGGWRVISIVYSRTIDFIGILHRSFNTSTLFQAQFPSSLQPLENEEETIDAAIILAAISLERVAETLRLHIKGDVSSSYC